MAFFLFIALILTVALMLFAVQNSMIITLTFIIWKFEGSFAFILALVFGAGMLTGIFLTIPTLWRSWRRARESRAERKRIKEHEGEFLNSAEQK